MYINYRTNESREMIIGYKSIFINIYTIIVMDITTESAQSVLMSHEANQLWESAVSGLFLKTKDFVTFGKDGINVVGVGSNFRRPVKDNMGNDKMIHSL